MEETKQISMETSLRAEQTLATATALIHVDMRAWETSERVQQQRRKVLPSPQHIHIKALQPGACLTQSASAPHEQAACGRSGYPKDGNREPGWACIQVDNSAAFDRVRWDFMQEMLEAFGFPAPRR